MKKIDKFTVETMNTTNYKWDETASAIRWTFIDIEPTTDNAIYVRYFNNPGERQPLKII